MEEEVGEKSKLPKSVFVFVCQQPTICGNVIQARIHRQIQSQMKYSHKHRYINSHILRHKHRYVNKYKQIYLNKHKHRYLNNHKHRYLNKHKHIYLNRHKHIYLNRHKHRYLNRHTLRQIHGHIQTQIHQQRHRERVRITHTAGFVRCAMSKAFLHRKVAHGT